MARKIFPAKKCEGKCGRTLRIYSRSFRVLKDGTYSARCRFCERGRKPQQLGGRLVATDTRDGTHRICARCGEEKPLDEDHFKRMKVPQSRSFSASCRKCMGARIAAARIAAQGLPAGDKRCACCARVFPRSPRHFPRRGRGLDSYCKVCHNAMCRAWRHSTAGIAARKSGAKSARKRWKKYKKDAAVVAKRTESSRRWRRSHPDMIAALVKVRRAVEVGLLKKPSRCGCRRKKIFAYIPDTSRPLENVRWFCVYCHPRMSPAKARALLSREDDAHETKVAEEARRIGVPEEALDQLVIPKDEWEAIHERYKALLAEEEAKLRKVEMTSRGDLASERAIFLWQCGNSPEKIAKMMKEEGWGGPTPPLERVLGCWVPAS